MMNKKINWWNVAEIFMFIVAVYILGHIVIGITLGMKTAPIEEVNTCEIRIDEMQVEGEERSELLEKCNNNG